jgi:hypothetical protein
MKTALVIGNGEYQNTAKLKNPTNDSRDMKSALETLGFKVFYGENLKKREMRELLNKFSENSRGSETSLFYYAGHGLQLEGENYLIPIDSKIDFSDDIPEESMNFSRVESEFGKVGSSNIFILDACRDNPFQKSGRSIGGRGLANPSMRIGNSIIAYSTSPNEIALDGSGANGIYTKYLKSVILETGISIEKVFKKVAKFVKDETGQKQTPWVHSNSHEDIYLNGKVESGLRAEDVQKIAELEEKLRIREEKEREYDSLFSELEDRTGKLKNIENLQKLEEEKEKLRELNERLKSKQSEIETVSKSVQIEEVREDTKVGIWSGGEERSKLFFSDFKKREVEKRKAELEKNISEIQNEVAPPFRAFEKQKPVQGEFEKTLDFQIREIEYQQEKLNYESEKENFIAKIERGKKERILKIRNQFAESEKDFYSKLLNSYFGKQKISMRYDPDKEVFKVNLNGLGFFVKVPIGIAEEFKKSVKSFQVFVHLESLEILKISANFRGNDFFGEGFEKRFFEIEEAREREEAQRKREAERRQKVQRRQERIAKNIKKTIFGILLVATLSVLGYFGYGEYQEYEEKRIAEENRRLGFVKETDSYKIYRDFFVDKKTNLMWQKKSGNWEYYTWQEAMRYCENLELSGYSNWRLPSRDEAKSLLTEYYGEYNSNWRKWFDANQHKRHNERFVKNEISQFLPYWIWTSTKHNKYSSDSWIVDFKNGDGSWGYQTDDFFAVCVRYL